MRLRIAIASLLAGIALLGTLGLRASPAAAEGPVPELAGGIPSTGFVLLTVTSDASPSGVADSLAAVGCDASWIAVTVGGEMLRFRPGGAVDAGFPEELPAGRPILALCAAASDGLDLANGSYELDGLVIDLEDGRSEFPAAPGSASMVTTTLTSWQAVGDFDGDGVADIGGIVVHSTGGTGNFRYLVTHFSGGSAVPGALLGDRIQIQRLSIGGGVIEVDYLDRAFGEGFGLSPTLPTSRGFALSAGSLAETPAGQWHLVSIDGSGLLEGTAIDATFAGGVVSGSAGCNSYSGGYEIDAPQFTVGPPIAVTARACETSIMDQELAYLVALETAQEFSISGDTLVVGTGGGDLVFQRANVEPTGAWTLTTLAGASVLDGTAITASFDGVVVSGSAGCNEYSGGYEVEALTLTLDEAIAVTLKACETSILDQELAYLSALAGAQRFSISGETLTIETSAGDLRFMRGS